MQRSPVLQGCLVGCYSSGDSRSEHVLCPFLQYAPFQAVWERRPAKLERLILHQLVHRREDSGVLREKKTKNKNKNENKKQPTDVELGIWC